ncbi:hypothetical protein [Sodalis sp.]|uniref:hypothetical protein n=1 Tax=Sodalis sp. (in: enterobacteria) TaxID=1898979 RepID=UPI003872AACE
MIVGARERHFWIKRRLPRKGICAELFAQQAHKTLVFHAQRACCALVVFSQELQYYKVQMRQLQQRIAYRAAGDRPKAFFNQPRLIARQREQLLEAMFGNRDGKATTALSFLEQGARKRLQPAALHRCRRDARGQ